MNEHVPKDRYPWWVRFALFGFGRHSRRSLWIWALISIALAGVLVAFGLWADVPFLAVVGLIGGILGGAQYWLTIRWIDQHGSWQTPQ
jgi:hypothetical protein